VHRLREGSASLNAESSVLIGPFPTQCRVKQLLLTQSDSDIAQKHPASRFTFTIGRGGRWEPRMKERLI
jgi:hypothetical protein